LSIHKQTTPVLEGTHLTALFGDGLSGSGGVNVYSASYTTSKDRPPSKVTVTNLVSTKMMGPEEHMKQERRFFNGLLSAMDISLLTNDKLTLSWGGGAYLLEFARATVESFSK
jgi:heat shock protein HslJ